MHKLIETARNILQESDSLPFSIYCSSAEQRLFNVPVLKPLLIFILSGRKELGVDAINCPAGSFVFLSNTPNIAMRNIPNDEAYFALLIEFDYADFDCLKDRKAGTETFFRGEIESRLELTLQQFIEWSATAPAELWYLRRQEILQLLVSQGFDQVGGIMEPPTLSHKVHTIISDNVAGNLEASDLASMLAMSESTLRRKLSAEGNSLQGIKDRARLGYGLHLLQTSLEPIGLIAEQCGYSSQSRFTDKFKQLFNLTPTELRKTRLRVSGE